MLLPGLININPDLPESNWPFLIYSVPDFPGAEAGTEFKGFYILVPVDKHFADWDDETEWVYGNVISEKKIMFCMPAMPYPLFPGAVNGQVLYKKLLSNIPPCVQKSMNNCHSFFDSKSGEAEDAAHTMAITQ